MELSSWPAPVPLTVHQVMAQSKFRNTGKTINRMLGGKAVTYNIFAAENGKDELYVAEVADQLVFDAPQQKSNVIVQLGYVNERVPEYLDTILFQLPGQMPGANRHKIAAIDYLLLSQLSTPLKEFR